MDELVLSDHVELSSGEKFNCNYLATIPSGYMFIAINSDDIGSVVGAFTDKEKTKTIKYANYVLEGFTVFCGINQEAAGRYKVTLRRAFAGEEV